ncbi:MAG: ATP-dependent RecD-like DNA helicase [Candidatus Anoxychlamydiales bacterium]|nr:ATP-dependent RecD-like DNA helicase [Candidatus Anoxychlamydiales bacterium]
MDTISGFIDSIIYVNNDNGFTIAKFQENEKKDFTTITGYMPSVQLGESLKLTGEWKTHPKFGRQFNVTEFNVTTPNSIIGIQKYLESGLIKGIGPIYAEKIVQKFGVDTLEIIDESPSRLLEVNGIGKKRVKQIIDCWDIQRVIRDIIIFLRSNNISSSFAQRIYKIYGDHTISKIKENPFRLAKDITGIGFKIADNLANSLGFEKTSAIRIQSGIEYVLYELTNQGHTCYPKEEFVNIAEKILEVDFSLIEKEINSLILKSELIQDKKVHNGSLCDFIWLLSFYNFEKNIALELNRLLSYPKKTRDIKIDKAIDWTEEKLNLELAENQKIAVKKALLNKVHIITGGPGTGKSTITNVILKIYEQITKNITLCAPTGRAAKRMSEITGKKASTIHSLLEFDFINGGFKRNENDPIKTDLIIVDEASMIDTVLMHHFLKAIPSYTKVIFVGDIDQLPSVGAGYILNDLINSEKIPFSKLTDIFRQAKNSNIILNAHNINKGEFLEIDLDENSDFKFYPIEDPENIAKKIIYLVDKELKNKHFDPFNDVQVIAPMKKGIIGIENLNTLMQNTLNPSSKPLYRAGKRFHERDKVMQMRNNYNKDVYNGDIGRIIKINTIDQEVVIKFDGKIVTYDFSDLDEIALAYAVSVHKYQGSECPCIIIPIHTTHYKLLYRNLLYTAVTRGKRLVIILGTKKAISIAINNTEVLKRFTGLEDSIRKINYRTHEISLFDV